MRIPLPEDLRASNYAEYAGELPGRESYMPRWPEPACSDYQMHEEVTEGTPLSPVCLSPQELATRLADHGANAFAGATASHEEWCYVARGGRAASEASNKAASWLQIYSQPTATGTPRPQIVTDERVPGCS